MSSPYNRLWTKTAYRNVPNLGETNGQGDDAVAHVKIFSIRSQQRWYVIEYDPETGRAFCLVTDLITGDSELGYSAIREVNPGDYEPEDRGGVMQCVNDDSRVPPFERDSSFKPKTVGEIKEKLAAGFAT